MYEDKNEKVADNKKIDNQMLDKKEVVNYKNKINEIDDRIDQEKSRMRELDDMEELFVSLSKNITKCVDLLNKSIKGNNISNKLNSIEENNKINFSKSIGNLEIERDEIKNNIVDLNNKKEDYQQKMKEENIKEELKENNSTYDENKQVEEGEQNGDSF